MIKLKRQYGALWELIFYHDITGGLFSASAALCSNNEKLYSIIGMIGDDYKNGEYFEYLLEYPEVPGYNRWKQKIAIANTTPGQTSADIGYKGVKIDFSDAQWGGIARSTTTCCTVFDGSPGDNNGFWYSIGATAYYDSRTQYPGPVYASQTDGVKYSLLWIRVPPRLLISCSHKHNFISNCLLFISLLSC
jgi:hypothetical protein